MAETNVQDANLGDIAETSQEKILGDADTAAVEAQEIIVKPQLLLKS